MRELERTRFAIAPKPRQLAVVGVALSRGLRLIEAYEVEEVRARVLVQPQHLDEATRHLAREISLSVDHALQKVRQAQPGASRETPIRKSVALLLQKIHVAKKCPIVEVVENVDV